MPNARLIKRRIKSAQNIAKITKAMEMVSASKMRRAQEAVERSRPYAEKLMASLQEVARHTDSSLHPLLQESTSGSPLLIMVSTDRGLTGSLNPNLFKAALEFSEGNPGLQVITVGRKAQEFAVRSGLNLIASFTDIPDAVGFTNALPMLEIATPGFLNGEFSSVTLLHMKFINTLTQESSLTTILPFQNDFVSTPDEEPNSEYVFEPSAQEILNSLLPAYLETMSYQILLDAKASEHSARMIAMQNASNNARDIVDSLLLEYNKSRQASITRELLEINTARLALTS